MTNRTNNQLREKDKNQPSRPKMNFKLSSFFMRFGTLLMIGLLVIFFSSVQRAFLTPTNWSNILRSISITTLVALGVTVSLSVDGFDLSIGSTAGLASIIAASMMIWYKASIPVTIIVSLLSGVLVGLVNSFLIVVVGIDDLLATLGMQFVVRGVLLTYAGGVAVHDYMVMRNGEMAPGLVTPQFKFLGQGFLGPIPVPVLIMVIIVVIVYFFMNHTRWGRYLYIIGGNREAAFLSGIRVDRYRTLAYVISGLLAAAGGIILTARLGTGELRGGDPFLMESVMASFVGYSVLASGKPNVFGTFVGAIFTGIMVNGLTMINVPVYSLDIFKGVVLIAAVSLHAIQKKSHEKS